MRNVGMPARNASTAAKRDREFWSTALLACGFTALPRWTSSPERGVAEHAAKLPDDLAAALRRLADELSVSLSSVLLCAHAKVLGALSGERHAWTGYAAAGRAPLPGARAATPPPWGGGA